MTMSELDESFYGRGDLEVGRPGAGRKEKELLLYFHICVPTYHSHAERRCCISTLVAFPYLLSLFLFFQKGREKIKTVWSEPTTESRSTRLRTSIELCKRIKPEAGSYWKQQGNQSKGECRFRKLLLPLLITTAQKHPPTGRVVDLQTSTPCHQEKGDENRET